MTKIIKRRRLEAKTDYGARLALLKSGKPRLVVRRTNMYIIGQIVSTDIAQDKVVFGATSQALIAKGWPKENAGSLKSKPAAYLLGYLIAKKSKDKVKEVILDIGMHRNVQKSRLYAFLKGAIDGGLKIPHSATSLPSLEEINSNSKLNKLFEKVKQSI